VKARFQSAQRTRKAPRPVPGHYNTLLPLHPASQQCAGFVVEEERCSGGVASLSAAMLKTINYYLQEVNFYLAGSYQVAEITWATTAELTIARQLNNHNNVGQSSSKYYKNQGRTDQKCQPNTHTHTHTASRSLEMTGCLVTVLAKPNALANKCFYYLI